MSKSACKSHVNILYMPFFKPRQHWNLDWCCQGFSKLPLSWNLCYDLCNMSVLLFLFFDSHWWLSVLFIFGVFTPPPPEWINWWFCFISFINLPASCTIPFFPCDVLILLIVSNCPSFMNIKKGKLGPNCCVWVYVSSFLSSASSENSVNDCWSYLNYR